MTFLKYILVLLASVAFSANAQTAVLFGASGAVGSEVLKSLIDDSSFDELILVGRKSSPKVDGILSKKKAATQNVTTLNLPDLHNQLATYDKIEKADACFIAIGVGDINKVTLQYWHSVEVDLIGSITQFCDKIQVRSLALLSAVDVEYESAEPFPQDEIHAVGQKPLGWAKSIYLYNRVKGLEEKTVVTAATNIPHIRLFRPSSIVTQEPRYGWIDRTFFFLHGFLDPYMPEIYHSVDARLLGMAFVADTEEVLRSSTKQGTAIVNSSIHTLVFPDYMRVAGEAFKERYQQESDEL